MNVFKVEISIRVDAVVGHGGGVDRAAIRLFVRYLAVCWFLKYF